MKEIRVAFAGVGSNTSSTLQLISRAKNGGNLPGIKIGIENSEQLIYN